MSGFNDKVVAEFRAQGGRVGGPFEGAPMILLHHVGRRSGREQVTPLMYLPGDDGTMSIFASAAGAPGHPAWYFNLTSAGHATVEVGTETFDVDVRELEGSERDEVFAEQVRRYPGFGEYADKTEGIRTIPVLRLTRR